MERIPEKNSEKESFLDLTAARKQLIDQIDQLDEQFYEKQKKEGLSSSWRKEKEQALLGRLVADLLKKKDSLQSVFETEKGSLYFVSNNGQSWRFKKENGSFKEQPLLNKIIFLEPQEAKKFIDLKKIPLFEEYLTGVLPEQADQPTPYVFKKSTLALGNIPLEIGVDGFAPVVFEENEKELKIIGVRRPGGNIERCFASGIHNGHPISKIY